MKPINTEPASAHCGVHGKALVRAPAGMAIGRGRLSTADLGRAASEIMAPTPPSPAPRGRRPNASFGGGSARPLERPVRSDLASALCFSTASRQARTAVRR